MPIYGGTGLPNMEFYTEQMNNVSSAGEVVKKPAIGVDSVRVQVLDAGLTNEVVLEGSMDDVTWTTLGVIAGNGMMISNSQGYEQYRLRTSVYGGQPFRIYYKGNPSPYTDKVRIWNGIDDLTINPDGSINVNAVLVDELPNAPAENVISEFSQISSVAANVTTNVLSYTVPIGKTLYLYRVEFGGTNIATYDVFINATHEGRRRTYFGGDLSDEFNFESSPKRGLKLTAGVVVLVKVLHARPFLGDFEARIQGLLIG